MCVFMCLYAYVLERDRDREKVTERKTEKFCMTTDQKYKNNFLIWICVCIGQMCINVCV